MLEALEQSGFSTWLRESGSVWAYPLVLTLHTTGMGILVGANWAVDFRLLGFGKGVPIAPLEKLFPIMWFGFWINATTGVLLFAADATTKGSANIFFLKLGLIVLAVIAAVATRRTVFGEGKDPDTTGSGRGLAIASLVLWLGAITAGRLMAYITL